MWGLDGNQGYYMILPLITQGFFWQVAQFLPFQTKPIVFLEYASVGIAHGCIALYKFKKRDYKGCMFHLFAACLGFIFPAYYWNHQMRLHHSFYGLIMMALPFRATKILGSLITFDSSLYMIAPWRGYTTVNSWGQTIPHEYGFPNTIVDHFPVFCYAVPAAVAMQDSNHCWSEDRKKKIRLLQKSA